ncbi:D-alanyl-D-alanine endopeptidase (penicillin-binding protein 7) [Silvimonas terrae]|uniref:D-alanyl-D-alanine endopeptidase (Penicillin-binding protein 7) n=1 Tax=Silvimonas terrae TaxID=300266 RepID=A0A840RAC8_9NEIS|nr:D-alanyl-D-alanine endopeptidase [Silvimonas terrae]MBB5189554.1 D-alanyl-D-alanine endopeptidase (penicillin-binding protein 7) [Silvimonas terrae]
MRPAFPLFVTLLTAATLSIAPVASATTTHKHKHTTQSASKKTATPKATAKTASARSTTVYEKGRVKRTAIANARSSVHVTRTLALSSFTADNPGLQSASVLILNENTGDVVYQKNPDEIAPIASITKLMTAMVTLDAHLPMNEYITISDDDVDTLKNSSSRLRVGTRLTRAEVMLLALMSSENRAAAALSRTYPGGRDLFIRKMNEKATELGMTHSHFYDSTGLTPQNVSSARDLVLMVRAARKYPEIHEFTTSSQYEFTSNLNGRTMAFHNTNPLVKEEQWDIGLTKTGFTNEAGHCLVMEATISGTPVVIVLLDSTGKYTRIGDANRVKKWLETSPVALARS